MTEKISPTPLSSELPLDADFYIDRREWRVYSDIEAAQNMGCIESDLIAAYKAPQSERAEPVAWRCKQHERASTWLYLDKEPKAVSEGEIVEPLYVHR